MSRLDCKDPVPPNHCYAPLSGSADPKHPPRGGSAVVQLSCGAAVSVARLSDPGPIPRGADLLDADLDLLASDMREAVIHCLRNHLASQDAHDHIVRALRFRFGRNVV